MGVYDTLLAGDRIGQVKCWDSAMAEYTIGDAVPGIYLGDEDWGDDVADTYSIAMREGGFVNITDFIFESWTDEPLHSNIYDKYGYPFGGSNTGLMGESYLYPQETKQAIVEDHEVTKLSRAKKSPRAKKEST